MCSARACVRTAPAPAPARTCRRSRTSGTRGSRRCASTCPCHDLRPLDAVHLRTRKKYMCCQRYRYLGLGPMDSRRTHRVGWLFVGVLQLASLLLGVAVADAAAEPLAVIGYMPEYRHHGTYNYSQAFAAGLTHVIFFSLEVHPTDLTPTAFDRLPPKPILEDARTAAHEHGGKLLLCFGGNSRTGGFPKMVLTKESRATFLVALDVLLKEHGFHGVDYNWEYPQTNEQWVGLVELIRESRAQLLSGTALVTAAFYPDPRQYAVIKHFELHKVCDFLLSMTYDQPGRHSTMEFSQKAIDDWASHSLPPEKLALGVPFYGRDTSSGHPQTYAELLPKLHARYPKARAKRDAADEVDGQYFNGRATIKKKVQLAAQHGLGGIMIWELGQDVIPSSHAMSLMSAIGEAKAALMSGGGHSGTGAGDSGGGEEEL
ncbi:hypothetical protein FOA52_003120 [Chlamydomonas sp. UWO 241]|nr:hypothetical protein FOA52_003120 [Chlamydomonas sp. UWO 241]